MFLGKHHDDQLRETSGSRDDRQEQEKQYKLLKEACAYAGT